MSSGWTVGDSITISSLAIKVYTAYQDGPEDYRHILEDIAALRDLIDKVTQHLEITPVSSVGRPYGQNALKSCQIVFEDLNSFMEKYKRLASANQKLASLGKKPIATLRERLISNTILLNGFARSCEYTDIQAQLAFILGLHHTNSRPTISIASIASFATNTNPQVAFKEFCEDLYQIGVTKAMIQLKKNEILAALESKGMVAGNIRGRSQLIPADRNSSSTKVKPSFRLTSEIIWSRSKLIMGHSSRLPEAGLLKPETIGRDISTLPHPTRDNIHIGIVELLWGKGASFKATDKDGNTLLHCAARDGHPDTVKILLRKGASMEALNQQHNTPLHLAAQSGHTSAVEALLLNGASTTAINQDSKTPLHSAAEGGHTSAVEVLLAKGASIEALDKLNRAPLHHAACGNNPSTVELLLSQGASPETKEHCNHTPLHFAAWGGYTRVVELLLSYGAPIEAMDLAHSTPLNFAARCGHNSTAELLISKGASIEAVDKDNNTILYLATIFGHAGIVRLLRRRAAQLARPGKQSTIFA